ncbi:phosphatase [Ruminococcaceae bacterium OttesenSCG-928-N02]|nr:phosphatase [Ruminococcaceae bacterium OttesenSCG-928-N02]
MKHRGLWAGAALLAAGIGALAATYVYLREREDALDDYEELLFEEYTADLTEEPDDADDVATEITHFNGDFTPYESDE